MWVLTADSLGLGQVASLWRVADLPHVALSAHAHNRLGLHRTDAEWLASRWADPATRVLVVAGSRLRVVDRAVSWVAPEDAPEGTTVLLGEAAGAVHFAQIIDPGIAPGRREEWVPLRAVLPVLTEDPAEAPLLFHAVGLAEWHFATRFCPRCAAPLESVAAGHELRCTACGRSQFPRTDPAVIMAVTYGEPGSDDERVLLGRNASWPEGRFSSLAGFCEPGETLEDAVRREVREETGVTVAEVTWFGNQPWPLPASLMLAFTGRAVTTDIDVDGSEIEEARWFTRAELRQDAEAGLVRVPRSVSISSSLLEHWFGEPLPGSSAW
ncbi:NAD(+) diphosphatase [Nocardioides gansuensis]|uniref:NAD(+) diphosphatase n=1 Tax=Nocardioides gansuensis TaxID=2138300 RepID=A0A2T8FBQ9_9ACTN|nr:NAD(+) diphosphatase [Nocardioides gansuensis]